MVSAKDVAMYFLQLDKDGSVFNKTDLLEKNGRKFYKGNARLNKYLHLAQNIYIAMNSEKLFPEALYAYDNGGVVKDIQEKYPVLLYNRNQYNVDMPEDIKLYLRKIYYVLKNASVERLMELSHQDPEWISHNRFYDLEAQKMDSLSQIEDYKERYEDIIEILESVPVC